MAGMPKIDKVEALRHERDRFVALAFCAADLLLETDQTQAITFAAGATKALTGRAPDALIGTRLRDLIAPPDRIFLDELVRGMRPGARLDPVPAHLAGPEGATPPLSLSGYRLPDMPGRYFFALRLGTMLDPELGRSLVHDPQSGLLDRESFARLAADRVKTAAANGEPLQLTLFRVEKMASLRARLDEEANQSLVATIGACLRASAEGGDAAGRLDEDSYGIVHRPDLDLEGVRARVETYAREADPQGVGITLSLGTLDADVFGMPQEDALRALHYALEQFCTDGATPLVGTLTEGLENLVHDTAHRVAGLRRIITEDRFSIAFQPIVEVRTRRINHFEALARFDDDHVDDSPYDTITFAEATGLICDFDLAMCRKVLNWMSDGETPGSHFIAANLSGRSLTNMSFVAALHDLLKSYSGTRSRLIFEITESAHVPDLDLANKAIQSLRSAGHKVCLDDFGAGAAAFQYLRWLEVDVVKIDGQYLRGAVDGGKSRAFLKAMSGLCRELGIDMIAEMVEDRRYLPLLEECGIRYAQGYLYGKPDADIATFANPSAPRARRFANQRSRSKA
jgi:EAL domain-containing protein (putative c-di-GMP-specific phosphodiesterase class I)/GGDEF domain-containing protein